MFFVPPIELNDASIPMFSMLGKKSE